MLPHHPGSWLLILSILVGHHFQEMKVIRLVAAIYLVLRQTNNPQLDGGVPGEGLAYRLLG